MQFILGLFRIIRLSGSYCQKSVISDKPDIFLRSGYFSYFVCIHFYRQPVQLVGHFGRFFKNTLKVCNFLANSENSVPLANYPHAKWGFGATCIVSLLMQYYLLYISTYSFIWSVLYKVILYCYTVLYFITKISEITEITEKYFGY